MPGTPLIQSYTAGELGVNNTAETSVRLQTAVEHLTKLQQLGMCLASYTFEQRSGLRPDRTHRRETVVAYAATLFVNDIVPINAKNAAVSPDKLRGFIAEPIHAYLDWCDQTGRTEMLADIYAARQYSVQQSSGVVFLHDIAPMMMDIVDDKDGGDETRRHYRKSVSNIARASINRVTKI